MHVALITKLNATSVLCILANFVWRSWSDCGTAAGEFLVQSQHNILFFFNFFFSFSKLNSQKRIKAWTLPLAAARTMTLLAHRKCLWNWCIALQWEEFWFQFNFFFQLTHFGLGTYMDISSDFSKAWVVMQLITSSEYDCKRCMIFGWLWTKVCCWGVSSEATFQLMYNIM